MNEESAAKELAEEMEEWRQEVVRTNALRVGLASAAIAYHVKAKHEGPWLALPAMIRCPDEECMEFSELVLAADEWLKDKRDWLDCKPLEEPTEFDNHRFFRVVQSKP